MSHEWHSASSAPHVDAWQQIVTLLYAAVAAGYPLRDILALVVIWAGAAAVRRRVE